MAKTLFIIKADGSTAAFHPNKVTTSLRRAGAEPDIARSIADTVAAQVTPGMHTKHIYNKAFALLKKYNERGVAARYSLKRSIEMLGPTGFPFELFVAALLKKKGYKTKVGIVMKGECVTHEVDVLAHKDNIQHTIECKFHNNAGYRTNIKVPLYIYARFLDIKAQMKKQGKTCHAYEQWIVTNTKFTKDAQMYGECKGLQLIGWRYPKTGGLETLIEETGLHPLTCLTRLKKSEKQALLKKDIVLACDLPGKKELLKKLNISPPRITHIIQEIKDICQHNTL